MSPARLSEGSARVDGATDLLTTAKSLPAAELICQQLTVLGGAGGAGGAGGKARRERTFNVSAATTVSFTFCYRQLGSVDEKRCQVSMETSEIYLAFPACLHNQDGCKSKSMGWN